jgi:hypothetical protein
MTPKKSDDHVGDSQTKIRVDEKEWQKLCDLVLAEPDPRRLSELLARLLSELDAHRQTLLAMERDASPSS